MRKEKRDLQRTDTFCKINANCQDENGYIPCDNGYECEDLVQSNKQD